MIDPQLGTDLLRPSEVDVGERRPREYGSDQRHERQRLRRQQPTRRRVLGRVGIGVGRQRHEADRIVPAIEVDGGTGRRPASERPRVAHLVCRERLLVDPDARLVADGHVAAGRADHQRKRLRRRLVEVLLQLLQRPVGHGRRQAGGQQHRQEGPERGEHAQVGRLDDAHVQEVVDHRRRAERAVVGERHGVIDARLHHERNAGREHRRVQVAELVDPPAEDQAEPVEEDLVLQVGAELETVVRHRGDGDVEVVAAHVAAVGQQVPLPDERRVADLGVERLRLEPETDRLAGARIRQQEVRRIAVQEVGEHLHPQVAPRVAHLA